MERVTKLINLPEYRNYIEKIAALETDRVFCGHDMGHFFDVARIAAIMNLEEELHISRELIYAAAMVHDIGRFQEYEEGIPHAAASADLAVPLLESSGFEPQEIRLITEAVRQHGNKAAAGQRDLVGILYRADKKSRNCLQCAVQEECNWPAQKKNMEVYY